MRRLPPFTLLALCLLTLIVLLPALAQPSPPPPPAPALTSDWQVIEPGGATVCSDGSPYRFFVRTVPQSSDWMVYFQGGGACWNTLTCGGEFYDRTVGTPEEELGFYDGIFNLAEPENPLASHNTLFIPYCTADVHIGDATIRYNSRLSIHHRGAVNAQAALDWLYAAVSAPDSILVTGSSAGAIASIYYAAQVMAQYPDARIAQFADGEVGAAPAGWRILRLWDIYANMRLPDDPDPAAFTINDLYMATAAAYPQRRFAQYTTTADTVQAQFYQFSVPPDAEPWAALMLAFLDELEAALDNFSSFVAGGDTHTVLATPGFYTYSADGVRFLDWFTAWLAGEPVANVRCQDCATIELFDHISGD